MTHLPESWTIPELLQLSGGYWATCALHAAVRLDLFTPLSERPRSAAELAVDLGADARGTLRLLEALAALRLVNRRDGDWEATPFAARHLARTSPDYLGHIVRHHHLLMDGWSRLHEAVTTGAPVRERSSQADDEEARASFLMGMHDLAGLAGPQVAAAIDLTGRRRLLDLGGGPGTYSIHFCRRNPELTATICDLPTTRAFAERTVAAAGLASRISFVAADYDTGSLPQGFDVAWLSHVLHAESPAGALALLRKAVGSIEPGGLVLVQEFILGDDRTGPPFPALFSLNMLVGTPGGQAYSGAELVSLLTAAGAVGARRLAIELPNGAGIVAATAGQG